MISSGKATKRQKLVTKHLKSDSSYQKSPRPLPFPIERDTMKATSLFLHLWDTVTLEKFKEKKKELQAKFSEQKENIVDLNNEAQHKRFRTTTISILDNICPVSPCPPARK